MIQKTEDIAYVGVGKILHEEASKRPINVESYLRITEKILEWLLTPTNELPLSDESIANLELIRIFYIGQLLYWSEERLLQELKVNKKTKDSIIKNIKTTLEALEVELGMGLPHNLREFIETKVRILFL